MRLVTFQTMDALRCLATQGELRCDARFVDEKRMGRVYRWITERMKDRMSDSQGTVYPLWCWVKCYGSICPPKRKGERAEGFDVKITFHKPKQDVFVTDYRRYSFLLNNVYLPQSLAEKDAFDAKLQALGITQAELKAMTRTDSAFLQVCDEIRATFDRCITTDSDILQGCVWSIQLDEVDRIDILPHDGYCYGSLNYKRANGQRINWQQDLYTRLP